MAGDIKFPKIISISSVSIDEEHLQYLIEDCQTYRVGNKFIGAHPDNSLLFPFTNFINFDFERNCICNLVPSHFKLIKLASPVIDFIKVLQEKFFIEANPLNNEDSKFFNTLNCWSAASSQMGNAVCNLNVPEKYKICKSRYLYRGLTLDYSQKRDICDGQPIKFQSKKATSWCLSKQTANMFADNGWLNRKFGCVVQIPTKKADIIINMNKLRISSIFDENEVIVRGNGLDKISKEDIIWNTWDNYQSLPSTFKSMMPKSKVHHKI